MSGPARPIALITGARGGMGQSLARSFGETHDLVLTDHMGDALNLFAAQLEQEGYGIAASVPGDLADPALTETLATAISGRTATIIHTAALSPALGGWRSILRVNLIATELLLRAVETVLSPGSVGILISSMAGHTAPAEPEVDALLSDPLAPDFLERIEPHLRRLGDPGDRYEHGGISYGLSKRAVIRMCEARVSSWAAKGARILSISPGTIWTPMGRKEAEDNPMARAVVDATPAGRWGTVMDIAAAARFLASPQASFITGTDLRVDGGVTAYLRQSAQG